MKFGEDRWKIAIYRTFNSFCVIDSLTHGADNNFDDDDDDDGDDGNDDDDDDDDDDDNVRAVSNGQFCRLFALQSI